MKYCEISNIQQREYTNAYTNTYDEDDDATEDGYDDHDDDAIRQMLMKYL